MLLFPLCTLAKALEMGHYPMVMMGAFESDTWFISFFKQNQSEASKTPIEPRLGKEGTYRGKMSN